MHKTVFLDRDGVINDDKGFVHTIDSFHFLPGVFTALKLLQDAGFKLVLITNQSAIGTGKYTEQDFQNLTVYMNSELAKQGIKFDSIHHCPHSPDAGCGCRKPGRSMIDQVLEKIDVDFKYSFFVGDKTSDIQLGHDIGCKTFLVKTGFAGTDGRCSIIPDYQVPGLLDAAKIMLDIDKKIKPLHEVQQITDKHKAEGKRIVTLNGSFDLLHPGHVYMIRESKKQGDILVLGLNSDNSIKQYKSKDRPVVPERSRAELIAALGDVDFVTILPYDAVTPNHFIDTIKPHVHANGAEYGENCIEAETVKKYGRLHLIPRISPGILSTTYILRKIQGLDVSKKECRKS